MKMLKVTIAMVTIVAMLAVAQESASAHGDKVYHGNDFATVRADHWQGKVCDEEADGHAVLAIWYLENGERYGAYDNGSGGSCTETEVFDSEAIKFQVCEEGKGCNWEWT